MTYTVCHAPSVDGCVHLQEKLRSFTTRADAIAYAVSLGRKHLEIMVESLPLQRGPSFFWVSGFRNANGTWRGSR